MQQIATLDGKEAKEEGEFRCELKGRQAGGRASGEWRECRVSWGIPMYREAVVRQM